MPKIVDHAERRDQIAQVACRVVAAHGFEQATIVRIARAAGYTTGMLAHYFDSKQEIILAALRLIMRRMEQRLTQPKQGSGTRLYAVLSEALPIDARRLQECAFWMAFWGQVSSDRRLKRINAWVHREYLRLVICINGLTASVVSSPSDWPAERQIRQLRLHLKLLRDWASDVRAVTTGRRAGR